MDVGFCSWRSVHHLLILRLDTRDLSSTSRPLFSRKDSGSNLSLLFRAGPFIYPLQSDLLHFIILPPAQMLRRFFNSSQLSSAALSSQTCIFASASASGGMFSSTPTLLGNKGGTPKEKKSPYRLRRKSYGVHFKSSFLKTTDWYYCPLCSEPKKEGEWCRREDCRQIKP